MDNSHLLRAPGLAAPGKLKQIQEAKTMMKVVRERAERVNSDPPPYTLLELIGKGSYGRVFKSQQHGRRQLVAVKIMDVDTADYHMDIRNKDEAIKDFTKEISILQALKAGNAKNINLIYDAFSFHSQLWIVSEYCPGGSVHTLMKACPRLGLEEKYIIPIARELAVAMKSVHDAKIIHRDIKAANILVTQDGQLQLCDFGVSGILENSIDKRSTIIGTPQWMAPELHARHGYEIGYGTEIDCWAFGCTVYEMATGQPPNARVMPERLHQFLSTAPKLLGDQYSPALVEFVAFCLDVKPETRPTAESILRHPFIANTSKKYPTVMLKELITRFSLWEQQGGQRASLFNPFGAAAPTMLGPNVSNEEDDWNFSTMDDAEHDSQFGSPPRMHNRLSSSNELTPKQQYGSIRGMTPLERAKEEIKATRGEAKLEAIFNENLAPYEYKTDMPDEEGDLELAGMTTGSAVRESVIDLDVALEPEVPYVALPDLHTVKASRTNRFYLQDEEEGYSVEQAEAEKPLPPPHIQPLPTLAVQQPLIQQPILEPRGQPVRQQSFVTPPSQPRDRSVPMARSATDGFMSKPQEWSFVQAQAELRAERECQNSITQPSQLEPIVVPRAGRRSVDTSAATKAPEWTMAQATAELRRQDSAQAFQPRAVAPPSLLAPPFRPNLKHTYTEPVGRIGDFRHQPRASDQLDFEPSDRTSIIEIDLDEGFAPPFARQRQTDYGEDDRPNTAVSSSTAVSFSTEYSGDGTFYLEDNRDILPPSPEQVSAALSGQLAFDKRDIRSSFHLHSQSEPVHLDRPLAAGPTHNHVSSNSFSSDSGVHSSYDHDKWDGVHARFAVIEQRFAAEDKEAADIRDALRKGESGAELEKYKAFPHHVGDGWTLGSMWDQENQKTGNWSAMADVPTEEIIRYVDGVEDEDSQEVILRKHLERLARARDGEVVDEEEQTTPVAPRRRVPDPNASVNGNGISKTMTVLPFFPVPRPPKPEALEEAADSEVVFEEMNRLLNDLVGGLRITRKVLNGQKTRRGR